MIRAPLGAILLTVALVATLAGIAAAHPPWGVVVGNQGEIYVSDLETIWKIDAGGRQSVFRPGVSGRHIHELTMEESGSLIGEDLTYDPSSQRFTTAIWRMTPDGNFSYVLPPTTDPPKGMSIWKDRHGNTYAAQSADNSNKQIFLLKRTPRGEVSTVIGDGKSADKFRQVVLYAIGGTAFGPDGSLYLTDRSKILKVTLAGEVTTIAQNIASERSAQSRQNSIASLMGLTVDPSGNVYAADFGGRQLLKITPAGNISTILQSDETWAPTGVAFKNGDLYVLEIGNAQQRPRVRRLSPDGKASVVAVAGEVSTKLPDTPAASNSDLKGAHSSLTSYALVGLCAVICAIGFVVWRVRKHKAIIPFT